MNRTSIFAFPAAAVVAAGVALAVPIEKPGPSQTGRQSEKQTEPTDQPEQADQVIDVKTLVAGNTQFALDLFDRLREQEGNLFYSPYSISTALAMTYLGARTQTAAEMAATLHFADVDAELHTLFERLAASMLAADDGDDADRAAIEFAIANRLWGQVDEPFLPDFLDEVREHYAGGFETVDFARATEEARRTINAWIAKKTNDKIEELLKRGDVTSATALVLTNAIYFKGDWAAQFDPEKTRDMPFHRGADDSVSTPMMRQTATFGYAETEQIQMLELPYDGDRLSMLVLLPRDRDGLAELEANLTAERLGGWIDRIGRRKVNVLLPKFRLKCRFNLEDHLAAMGMPTAFGGGADFSGMNGKYDLAISKVIHEAYVDVNEEGTEAAAATGVVMTRTSIERPPTFNADHPFLFLIRDRETGSILFLGRLADPAAGGG
jgi:serpin B